MSEFDNNLLGSRMRSLDVSPAFNAYSGVEMIVDGETSYFAGDRSGRVLTVQDPWGTQAQAAHLLSTIRGYQYQPYAAEDALLSPAAELGDAVTAVGIYSGIYRITRRYSALMSAGIEAPEDEELDHEYPYESKVDRVFNREIAKNRAQITLTATQIQAEVTRATQAEGTLSTRITQTATEIRSEVTRATQAEGTLSSRITQNADTIMWEVRQREYVYNTLSSQITMTATQIQAKVSKTGGNAASFGWTLTDSSWTLQSGSKTVLRASSSGIEITGKVTATSGYIGNGSSGFTISARSIYNGMTSLNDNSHNGVYVGTDGIACGAGAFKVTSAGAITARNLEIVGGSINLGSGAFQVSRAGAVTASNLNIAGGSIRIGNNFSVDNSGNVSIAGTLTVGGSQITADALRSGAQRAYNNGQHWDNTTNWVGANGEYCRVGAGGGYRAIDAFDNDVAVSFINTNSLTINNRTFKLGSLYVFWTWIKDQNGISRRVLASANGGMT